MSRTFYLPADPVESHKVISGPLWALVKAMGLAGHDTVAELRTAEDRKTDKQRRFLHGYVLKTIAQQAAPGGQRFDLKTWKEHLRATFLGFKTITTKNPITGKRVRSRHRVSTEDLGVKGYSEYIDRVMAYAATEQGVEFLDEWVDPETGEVYQTTAMKSRSTTKQEMETA